MVGTAVLLSASGSWAYAAPFVGGERTGTWVALAVAAGVAVVAGVAAVVGPSGRRKPSRRPLSDDTMVQRALAAETSARRADTDHRRRE